MIDLTTTLPSQLPAALTALHRATVVGRRTQVRFPVGVDPLHRDDVAVGGGFAIVRGASTSTTTLERQWSLPDTVGPGMRLLVSGLNPSPGAADAGIGFARPGNRYWPAALAAGIVAIDRDPDDALRHGIGMTDIVKRTTRRADELTADEYRDGIARLHRMAERLRPRAVCFVGLAGWRAAVDKRAVSGWQEPLLGGRPVYVMPSTSGLNASSSLDDLSAHLRAAANPPLRDGEDVNP